MEQNNGTGDQPHLHLGKALLAGMRKHADTINQIDAATGESETNGSVLNRSVKLARAIRNRGLKPGDVLALAGPNHLDIAIPYYAATFNGLPIVGIDPLFKYDEIRKLFSIATPRIVFCQSTNRDHIEESIKSLRLETIVVVFDEENNLERFIEDNGGNEDEGNKEFEAVELDEQNAYVWLISTSGTTGIPKLAVYTHSQAADWITFHKQFSLKGGIKLTKLLFLSPVQWVSFYLMVATTALMPLYTRIQTSKASTDEHIVEIINKYKPTKTMLSPIVITRLLNYPGDVDWTSFDNILLGGSKVFADTLIEMKKRTSAYLAVGYGQTETRAPIFIPIPGCPLESCGIPIPRFQYKLQDIETEEEITEPHKTGELLFKGPVFKGYYKNPKATAESFTEDGFYKTGDLFYKDENNFYFCVDRIKMLIKVRGYHVSPPELEEVIRSLDGIAEVVVSSVPDPDYIDVPVACVVRRPGAKITAQEIKDVIKERLSDAKQLRGGVIFFDELPMTSTGKIARHKLQSHISNLPRE